MRERGVWRDLGVSDIVGTMLMVAVVVLLGSSVAIVVTSTISSTTVPAAAVQMGALRAGDAVVSVVLSDGDPIPLDTLGIRLERNGSTPATVARASWTTPDPTSWRAGDRLSFPVSPVVAPEEEIRVRVIRGDASSQVATVTARVGGTTSLTGSATLTAAISPSTVLADGVAPALVTVRVSHPAGAGAVSGVIADLEDLTGAEEDTLALNDAGLDGDVQGGDGVWSALVRAPASTTLRPHTIDLSAIDLAGATTGTASVTLTVSQSLAELAEQVGVLDGSVELIVNVSRVVFADVPSSLASGSTTTLTLRLQDNLGVTAFAPRPIAVALGTNSTIGYFLSGGSIVSSVTIPTASSSITVQYVDYRSGGLSQLGAYADGIVPASAAIPVTGRSGKGIPDHLEFTSVPTPITAGADSAAFTLTLRDGNNETVTPPVALTIQLASNTLGSTFLDATTLAPIDAIVLPASASSVTFRYRDAGYQAFSTITAFANDTIPAFTRVPVSGASVLSDVRLAFRSVPASLASGSTATLTLDLRDHLDAAKTATTPLTVSLGTNSTVGYFLSGGSIVRSVTLAAGASSTTVEYVDYRSGGASQVTAFADGIVPASGVISVTGRSGKGMPDHLEFTSVPSTLASRTTSSMLTLTLRDSNNETVTPPSTLTILLVSNTLGSYFVDATTGASIQTINMSTSESSVSFKYHDAGYQSLSAITAFANDTIPAFAQIPITGYGTLPITFYGTCSGCTVTGGSILFEGDRLAVPASAATTSFHLKNWTYDRADPSRVLDDSMASRIISETYGWTMYFQFGITGSGTTAVPGIKSIGLWNKNVTTTYEATAGQVSLIGLDLDMTSSASIESAGFTCKTTAITGLGLTATADGCTNAMVYRNADIRGSPTFLLSWLRDESNNNNGPTKTGMFGFDVVVSS